VFGAATYGLRQRTEIKSDHETDCWLRQESKGGLRSWRRPPPSSSVRHKSTSRSK